MILPTYPIRTLQKSVLLREFKMCYNNGYTAILDRLSKQTARQGRWKPCLR